MGKYTFAAGAFATVALMSFIDGMLLLETMNFPLIAPFLLSMLGFLFVSLSNPFLLGSVGDSTMMENSGTPIRSFNSDPFLQIRHRASFVLGVILMLSSTAISLTLNGVGNDSAGCIQPFSGNSIVDNNLANGTNNNTDGNKQTAEPSALPGFCLVFQGWCWLASATCLYLDKCIVARGNIENILTVNPDE